MTTGHYLRSMKQLTNQWNANNFRDERRQRLYLKDIDCPVEWSVHLQKVIPPSLWYLNDNISYQGGSRDWSDDIFGGRSEGSAAPAGDLMSSLPEEMRAQNLMCYIGHEGTYTPAHREMCASLGQNIMVDASSDKNGEKPGSSIWFMTETKDREVVREYFLSMLGHDIEIEKHFAQINAWKKATFPVYVVEQKPGDFILVPPLAVHQVWNRGTRTVKVAWNRTTVETLDFALHEALPKARLVCRDEQYKNKAIIYYTLQKYSTDLVKTEENAEQSFLGFGQEILKNSIMVKQLEMDFKRLFALFTELLINEMFAYKEKDVEYVEFDSCITCSYCRSNIFNRFLTCKNCVRLLQNGDEDAYDVCMECYAMGRSCYCISGLKWCEQWQWADLVGNYEAWRAMVIKIDGYVDMQSSPQPLEVAYKQRGKKAVAQICQDSLRRRPYKDITKADNELNEKSPEESEPEVNDEGRVVKRKSKRKRKHGDVRRCHVCCHKEYTYRLHQCTNPGCGDSYCYGVLYRGFDLMPQTVMEDENWKCPKCLKICNCGSCLRAGTTNPYTSRNTLLGHDTRAIADDRSVESLVDFRLHNLKWLKKSGEEARSKDSRRMQKLREQADVAKAQEEGVQVEAAQTIANCSDGAAQSGHAHMPEAAMNGYGDHSHMLGQQPMVGGYGIADSTMTGLAQQQPGDAIMEGDNSMTVVDTSLPEDNESAYPDPSMLGHRRIGMGYYEQDDSPDKILFDPYQMPPAETMQFDEPDVPGSLRKQVRAAKRKARLENDDDPDFHYQSWRKTAKIDGVAEIDQMDPALFGNNEHPMASTAQLNQPLEQAPDAPGREDELTEASAQLPQELRVQAMQPVNRGNKGQSASRFKANMPSLRHARPIASYAEADDVVMDDAEDMLPAWSITGVRKPSAPNKDDPVGPGAHALQTLLKTNKANEPESTNVTTPKAPKQRGRPPKNLNGSAPSSAGSGRRSRRLRRPALSVAESEDDPTTVNMDEEPEGDLDASIDELEAELARELAEEAEAENGPVSDVQGGNSSSRLKRLVGRKETAGRPAADSSSTPTAKDGPAKRRSRRLGRLRQSEIPEFEPPTASEPASESATTKFLSMAERMALRGKTFKMGNKMGKRKSSGEAVRESPNPAPTSATHQTTEADIPEGGGSSPKGSNEGGGDEFVPELNDAAVDGSSSSASSTKAASPGIPTPPFRPRPTTKNSRWPIVVRLKDTSESDNESDGLASIEDEDGHSIPTRGPRLRGRGGLKVRRSGIQRGRGWGRG
jgi:hypothetical protein